MLAVLADLEMIISSLIACDEACQGLSSARGKYHDKATK